jgi:cytochrome c nitrite reductase small subunit
MKSTTIIKFFIPPDNWKLPVILVLGIICGLGFYLLKISKATSYLSDDPATCVNCHIMSPQYATWGHSSHRQWANCNDCHVPHNNVFNKYYFKAKDGLRHSTIFTMRNEPQVIFIHEEGQEVVFNNCKRCHSNLLDVDQKLVNINFQHSRSDRKCWECHREVPHGRVNSLSSTPNARVPLPESPVPDWLNNLLKKN